MRTRVTAMAGASLFATTGLLGAYVGYPGLRRAAAATTCTVTTNADAGAGSLRDCLDQINTPGIDTINFNASIGTITLGNDLPTVTRSTSVTITGAGQDDTIINANRKRGFNFTGYGDVNISNLTIYDAYSPTSGGAVYNKYDDITITDSTFEGNDADFTGGAIANWFGAITIRGSEFTDNRSANWHGGAIYNRRGGAITVYDSSFRGNTATFGSGGAINNNNGAIEIIRSPFTNNTAYRGGAIGAVGDIGIVDSSFDTNTATTYEGGAVQSSGSTTIEGSTFTNNSTIYAGGAVWSRDAVSITDSTFYRNAAGSGYSGGAVYVSSLRSSASVAVVNSTFTNNTADAGSALFVAADDGTGTLSVNFSTVTGNTARTAGGAGVQSGSSTNIDITNSILYNNVDSSSPRAARDVATGGHLDLTFSLLTSATSFSATGTTTTSNLLYGDPLLGALADNGGDTRTMLPSADSPVIGMANPTGAPATDQRGFTRTTNGLADMGSVERGGTPPEPDLSQMPPSWFQAQQRREQSATCPPGMVPSWAQWPNEGTGGWTCEWTTWWDVHKGSTGGWVTTPGFNPGLRLPE